MQLEALNHPNDDPALVRNACFYVGWLLRSPDSWEYINLFPQSVNESRDGVVTIPTLIEAVKRKHETLEDLKNPQRRANRISANDTLKNVDSANGKATKRKSKR